MRYIGTNVERKEGWDKVTGKAKYTADINFPGMLYAALKLSTEAHAEIVSIDTSEAAKVKGVAAIVTGDSCKVLTGPILKDRPPLAFGRVRYYGEPVAIVVASEERAALCAAYKIKIEYKPLPVIETPSDALKEGAFLIHDALSYEKAANDVYPEEGRNVSNKIKIRKGDIKKGFGECKHIIEARFFLPQCCHAAMETRAAICEISANGVVTVITSSQSPFEVQKTLAEAFGIDEAKIRVKTPFLGGAFGGKSCVMLETIAYLASKAVGGRAVKVVNTREHDMVSPCKEGLEARIKIGADGSGIIKAAEIIYLVDAGAYSDIAPKIAQAMAVDCTGPYKIENLYCDSISVYTNHPFVTAFRGFGHVSSTFCIERAIDKLAKACGIDPFEFRYKNLIKSGDETPTLVKLSTGNMGDIKACFDRIRSKFGVVSPIRNGDIVRAVGFASFWKVSNTPSDIVSGAVVTFNDDGSARLNIGAVEFGQASKTHLAAILAEVLRMNPERISVDTGTDTELNPKHWKTVASLTTYLAGKAVVRAGEDAIRQLKDIAAVSLRCSSDELDYGDERVFIKHKSEFGLGLSDLVHGLKYGDGNAVGGQIIGRGSAIAEHITALAEDTGKGNPGIEWSAGVQAAEVEFNKKTGKFTVLRLITAIDIGKAVTPETDIGIIKGGMNMGYGLATKECFYYGEGRIINTSFRTYKLNHIEDSPPSFEAELIETPNPAAPFGTRPFSEHGILGIPAAIANALSQAVGTEFDTLPINAEIVESQRSVPHASV